MKPLAGKLLIVCAALIGAAVFSSSAAAAPPTSGHPKGSLLYVQETVDSSIQRLDHGAYRLRLTGVSPRVTTFTDRPQRRAGSQGLQGFVDSWAANGFAADPPNAALVLDHAPASRDVALLTLSHPHYDRARQILTYRAMPLHGRDAALSSFARRADPVRAGELGAASLFLDDGGLEETGLSFEFIYAEAEAMRPAVQFRLFGPATFAIRPTPWLLFSGTVAPPTYSATSKALTMNFSPGTTFSGTLDVPIRFEETEPVEVEVTNMTGVIRVWWPTSYGPQMQELLAGEQFTLTDLAL